VWVSIASLGRAVVPEVVESIATSSPRPESTASSNSRGCAAPCARPSSSTCVNSARIG
jgi:hypothetical protein